MATVPHPHPVNAARLAPLNTYPFGAVFSGWGGAVWVMIEAVPGSLETIDLGRHSTRSAVETAVAEGVLLLADRAEQLKQPMRVYVENVPVRHAACRMLNGSCSLIEMVSICRQAERLSYILNDILRFHARTGKVARRPIETPTVVVGTDASMSHYGRGPVGYAWVSEHGKFGAGSIRRGSTNLGELRAIQAAVEAFPHRNLVILTDSQAAVSVLLGNRKPSSSQEEQSRRAVLLAACKYQRTVVVQWVHGHDGVTLNEAAHRLAMNEYRRASMKIKFQVARATAQSIVDDFASALNSALPELDSRWRCVLGVDAPPQRPAQPACVLSAA